MDRFNDDSWIPENIRTYRRNFNILLHERASALREENNPISTESSFHGNQTLLSFFFSSGEMRRHSDSILIAKSNIPRRFMPRRNDSENSSIPCHLDRLRTFGKSNTTFDLILFHFTFILDNLYSY